MKTTKYNVWFTNGSYKPQYERITALNSSQAIILAKAERIKLGLDYAFHKIEIVK